MESDSTYATIALASSLVLYTLLSVAKVSAGASRRDSLCRALSVDPSRSDYYSKMQGLAAGLAGLNLLALSAVMVSVVAVTIGWRGVEWAEITVALLAALAVLGLIRGVIYRLALRHADAMIVSFGLVLRLIGAVSSLWLRFFYVRRVHGLGALATGGNSSEIALSLDSDGEPLDEHEVRMIRAVVRLDETVAREIMVPRVDMVAVDVEMPISILVERMVESGHSRVPVFQCDLDHIVGIAHARDVLDRTIEGGDATSTTVREILRPALFTPESKTLEELLSELQQRRVHMAIVVDEYGGVSGIVTIEDLLEEIVGEIQDEFDDIEAPVVAVSDDEYLIEAGVGVDQLNELLDVSIDADGFDTLGGLVYQRQGRIPSTGDAVVYDGLRIEVVSTAGRRLKRLRVTKLPADKDALPAD